MPTYKLDEGFFEEYDIPINEEEWTRSPDGDLINSHKADSVTLDPLELEASQQKVWFALKKAGATELRCSYDGGGDEGFAHLDAAQIGGQTENIDALSTRFADGSLGPPSEASFYPAEYLKQLSPQELAKNALDFLAYTLATKILWDGFGTGVEGEMYGAFRVDMNTGEIVDEPDGVPE